MGVQRRRDRRRLWLALSAVAAVAVLGFWGVQRWRQRDLPERALIALAAADSVRVQAELTLHLPPRLRGAERPFTEVVTRVAGDVRYTEAGVPELAGTLYAEARGRGTIFFADGDVRVLADDVRFRLDNIPIFLHRSGALVNRWTRVPMPLLATRNPADVRQVLEHVFSKLVRGGSETIEGERLVRFSGSLSEETEAVLQEVLHREISGNLGWHMLARLIAVNNVSLFEAWIDPDREELRRVAVDFARPLRDGSTFDFARLVLTFRDAGAALTVDQPETLLVVQPEVFATLFGTGEVRQ